MHANNESSHMITGFSNYPYLQETFDVRYNANLSPPPGSNLTVPNSTDKVPSSWPWDNVTDVLSPDVSEALKTLRNALNGTISGTTPTMVTAAEYTPNSNSVLPTYMPIAPQPSIIAVAPTDAGTGAEDILAGATLTPSLRQMIRNDISGAVKKEFENVNSRYQIQYNYE